MERPKLITEFAAFEAMERGYEEMSIHDAIDYLHSYGWTAKTGTTKIYRGAETFNTEPCVLTPGSGRPSKNTTNHYTLLLNNLPNWSRYPKRELICTTDEGKAESYAGGKGGYMYEMVGGDDWGVCPFSDMWESFDNHFRDFICKKFEEFETYDRRESRYGCGMYTIASFNSWMNRKNIPDKDYAIFLNAFGETFGSEAEAVEAMFSAAMDPKKNGFSLMKYDQIRKFNTHEAYEVWTDSEVVAVPYSWKVAGMSVADSIDPVGIMKGRGLDDKYAKLYVDMFTR